MSSRAELLQRMSSRAELLRRMKQFVADPSETNKKLLLDHWRYNAGGDTCNPVGQVEVAKCCLDCPMSTGAVQCVYASLCYIGLDTYSTAALHLFVTQAVGMWVEEGEQPCQ